MENVDRSVAVYFSKSEYDLRAMEVVRNNRALKGKVT